MGTFNSYITAGAPCQGEDRTSLEVSPNAEALVASPWPVLNLVLPIKKERKYMESVIIEIRAAEGGDDSKLLVQDMVGIYRKSSILEGL